MVQETLLEKIKEATQERPPLDRELPEGSMIWSSKSSLLLQGSLQAALRPSPRLLPVYELHSAEKYWARAPALPEEGLGDIRSLFAQEAGPASFLEIWRLLDRLEDPEKTFLRYALNRFDSEERWEDAYRIINAGEVALASYWRSPLVRTLLNLSVAQGFAPLPNITTLVFTSYNFWGGYQDLVRWVAHLLKKLPNLRTVYYSPRGDGELIPPSPDLDMIPLKEFSW